MDSYHTSSYSLLWREVSSPGRLRVSYNIISIFSIIQLSTDMNLGNTAERKDRGDRSKVSNNTIIH